MGILLLCRNGHLGASGQKSDSPFASATSILYKTDVFPLPSYVYGIYSMFLCYYVVWSCDLWPFWPWQCFIYSASHAWHKYQFWLPYNSRFLITFPLSGSVTAHAQCHVTYNWGAKMIHIFDFFLPQFAYSLCHFQGTTTKIKPCYWQK